MIPSYTTSHSYDYNPEFQGESNYTSEYQDETPYSGYQGKTDYDSVSQKYEPTEEEIELWVMVGGTHEGVSFGRRVALAASHFCHIPESILNLITNVVKLVFTAIACAFSFGQVDLLNNEFRLALGRSVINFAGIGIHTIGLVAPVTAFDWNQKILLKMAETLKTDAMNGQPGRKENPDVIVPMMMSI